MRLIDADELIKDLQYDVELDARALDSLVIVGDRAIIQFDKDCKQNCIDLLRNAPTVIDTSKEIFVPVNVNVNTDEVLERVKELGWKPVEHGQWIRHPEQKNIYGGKCVECSKCGEKYIVQYIEDEKFCRNCGALMDGGKDET